MNTAAPLLLLPLLVLGACDRGPPGPSAAQNRQLDEAERMLDEEAAQNKGATPEDAAPPLATNRSVD